MAKTDISVVVDRGPANSVTFTSVGPLAAPVDIGTTIGSFQVDPADWDGAVTLSGADAAKFEVDPSVDPSGRRALRNTVQLDAQTYNMTAVAAP